MSLMDDRICLANETLGDFDFGDHLSVVSIPNHWEEIDREDGDLWRKVVYVDQEGSSPDMGYQEILFCVLFSKDTFHIRSAWIESVAT